jgi:hypothetical protein
VYVVGWIGLGLLCAAALVTLLRAATLVPRAIRVGRRWRRLAVLAVAERQAVASQVESLRTANQDREAMLRATRRRLGWARHPLTLALLQSYRRRRAPRA